jgi:hypothetical protein
VAKKKLSGPRAAWKAAQRKRRTEDPEQNARAWEKFGKRLFPKKKNPRRRPAAKGRAAPKRKQAAAPKPKQAAAKRAPGVKQMGRPPKGWIKVSAVKIERGRVLVRK